MRRPQALTCQIPLQRPQSLLMRINSQAEPGCRAIALCSCRVRSSARSIRGRTAYDNEALSGRCARAPPSRTCDSHALQRTRKRMEVPRTAQPELTPQQGARVAQRSLPRSVSLCSAQYGKSCWSSPGWPAWTCVRRCVRPAALALVRLRAHHPLLRSGV